MVIDLRTGYNATTENFLYFTVTNFGFVNYVKNLYQRLQQLNMLQTLIVICTDKESYNDLKQNTVLQCVYYPCDVPKTLESIKTPNFKLINLNKLDILRYILLYAQANNIERVVYIEADIWVYRNFIPELIDFVNNTKQCVDVLLLDGEDYSVYNTPPVYTFGKTLSASRHCTTFNTGIMVLACNDTNIKLVDYKQSDINIENISVQNFINNNINRLAINAACLPRDLAHNSSIITEHNTDSLTDNKTSWLLHYNNIINSKKHFIMKNHNHWLIDSQDGTHITYNRNGRPHLYAKCTEGFVNQLRMLLAGTYLVQTNCIASYTQEWTITNQNNVDYNQFFEPLPGVAIKKLKDVSADQIITASSFTKLIQRYAPKNTNCTVALKQSLKYLKTKPIINDLINLYSNKFNITDRHGVHARRTCKIAMLLEEPNRSMPLSNDEIFAQIRTAEAVYLATDNKETQQKFIRALGNQLCYSQDITQGNEKLTCTTYSPDIVRRYTDSIHTIIDLYMLKNCKIFLGSHESSFSLLVYYWRNNENDYLLHGVL